ncbi:DUF2490 domain-containing protein [Mucilaginibacter rubeus]|uniref:DUF2490 domain-containing protein n=1 Tax=Mucilaginibacter rubeus TaxID=2027860 RepID=UPI00166AD510|nr:DUF2490 domain-containing protein [Mucilaginibacter rubeus]GGB13530.1 hypothetical protein GCM10011500_31890 [Mucilaginibacter rubeus]
MQLKKQLLIFAVLLLAVPARLLAQDNQFSGWAAIFHSQKLSEHWGYSFDGQLRSHDEVSYLKHILLRPSANYYFAKNKVGALGYAYIATYGRTPGNETTFRPEHRIWQQYTYTHKLTKHVQLAHRFRLEQRFLGNTAANKNDRYFAQRFRYFARAVIPMKPDSDVFTEGAFLALQNEAFVNVQNKNKVNKHFFDQNRAYVAVGYRFSKSFDAEAGYLNQYIKQADAYVVNHVAQLAFYTRF